MFERRATLFKLLGFEVKVDITWTILALLVTWTLALGFFPERYENLTTVTYWWMGVIGALGLFASIVFHELCHSLVARRNGLPMEGITLFIFGGVAEMHEEPASPKAELWMAVAGPLSSILLALIFYLASLAGKAGALPLPVTGVISYLALINGILAGFNLLPAFPLDGGRILRAILWMRSGSLRLATRIASGIGSGFGTLLIILGVFSVLFGSFIGGIWWFMI